MGKGENETGNVNKKIIVEGLLNSLDQGLDLLKDGGPVTGLRMQEIR